MGQGIFIKANLDEYKKFDWPGSWQETFYKTTAKKLRFVYLLLFTIVLIIALIRMCILFKKKPDLQLDLRYMVVIVLLYVVDCSTTYLGTFTTLGTLKGYAGTIHTL